MLEVLGPATIPGLIEVFRDLPVCGMHVAFAVDRAGSPSAPVMLRSEDYEPGRDHEFYWMAPEDIVEDLVATYTGPAVLAAGYTPIGMCAMGGDYYYLKHDSDQTRLYQLYHDWIDPADNVPIPDVAIGFVSASFAHVLRVARFYLGP
ncbi:MAG: hypothetical protein IPM18_17000 [Phycisphaerales bacterium]|nr:hypothetical protein [Phycisphaerales bacterium]